MHNWIEEKYNSLFSSANVINKLEFENAELKSEIERLKSELYSANQEICRLHTNVRNLVEIKDDRKYPMFDSSHDVVFENVVGDTKFIAINGCIIGEKFYINTKNTRNLVENKKDINS